MNDLPIRKKIRLTNYDYSQNGAYFVTICTYNRAHIFGEIVGSHLCVRPNTPDEIARKWLFELENKYLNIKIDKYVIMPDHIHFIAILSKMNFGKNEYCCGQTGAHIGAPLPGIIQWFKTQTTNEYIRGVKNNLFCHLTGTYGNGHIMTMLLGTKKIIKTYVNTMNFICHNKLDSPTQTQEPPQRAVPDFLVCSVTINLSILL